MSPAISDEAERGRICSDIANRYVVVAGAGSGKTTSLVRRVANTINAGISPAGVAVITFTDKAARELVHKLRFEGIVGLDDVYIGTIHGFCAAILRRFPIEAGLPPTFSTADEITSRTAATDRRRQILQQVYDAAATDPLLLESFDVVARLVGLGQLNSVVDVIDTQWQRFEDLDIDPPAFAPLARMVHDYLAAFDDFAEQVPNKSGSWDTAVAEHRVFREAALTLASILQFAPHALGRIGGAALQAQRDALAPMRKRLQATASAMVIRRIVSAFRDLVVARAEQRINDGQLGYDDLLILTERLLRSNDAVRTELRQRYQRIFVDEFQDTDAVQFAIIEQLTADSDDRKGGDGNEGVGNEGDGNEGDGNEGDGNEGDGNEGDGRDVAASPRLFAVGDPKQSIYGFRNADVELFAALAETADRRGYLARLTANFRSRVSVAEWINAVMIQRFAQPAAISQKVQNELTADGLWPPTDPVTYERLQATRPAVGTDAPDPGPPVVVLGVDETARPVKHTSSARAQEAEANDIVGLIQRVVDEGWRVLKHGEVDLQGRPVSWVSELAKRSDIAVLVARRTGLATLESAFRNAAIPFRVEGGTLAYESREVYELLRVARAIDNPSDELMLVTALRTSILGCSDADLFAYRHRQPGPGRGRWRLPSMPFDREVPGALDDSESAGVARVQVALAQMADWSAIAYQMSPASLLATIYDSSMGVAAARFDGVSSEVETWRRVRFLIDEARAWTDEVGGTLHEYLAWVSDKVEAVDRSEIAPDEQDEDSVRILTIHAAKGLEFPIVIVAALGAKDNFSEDSFKLALVDQSAHFKLGSLRSERYPGRDRIAAWAEEARLLYVATTRAQDHLVLSCHTSDHASPNAAERLAPYFDLSATERWSAEQSHALRLALDLADLQTVGEARPVSDGELATRPDRHRRLVWTPSALATRLRAASSSNPDDSWSIEGSYTEEFVGAGDGEEVDQGEREGQGERGGHDERRLAGRPAALLRDNEDDSADPGYRKDPPSGREVVRSRGRYGTDIGIAVHEVMQLVNLRNPADGFDELVAIACDNVDLVGTARDRVAVLASSLIASPLFARMMSAPLCEREVYVATMIDAEVEPIALWGYIDAVFQLDDGSYAVVDFKTDSAAATAEELAARYGVQLNAYGVAVERSTGRSVGELWLLVANADGHAQQVPIERQTPSWPTVDRPPVPRVSEASPFAAPGGRRPEQLTLL